MKRLSCKIRSIDRYNANTRRVILEIPVGETISFKAGQYLDIILSGKHCPFSIASSPDIKDTIELHIRPTPGSDDSVAIEKLLDLAASVEIEIPKGDCFVDAPVGKNLILIGASTGITQMKSIIEFLLPRKPEQPIWLYWGVLSAADLYLTQLCLSWEREFKHFTFVPVVSEPDQSPEWSGRTGLLPDAVVQDFSRLDDTIVYVSGSPGMVYATYDRFIQHGMSADDMFSDVFSYAPRTKK